MPPAQTNPRRREGDPRRLGLEEEEEEEEEEFIQNRARAGHDSYRGVGGGGGGGRGGGGEGVYSESYTHKEGGEEEFIQNRSPWCLFVVCSRCRRHTLNRQAKQTGKHTDTPASCIPSHLNDHSGKETWQPSHVVFTWPVCNAFRKSEKSRSSIHACRDGRRGEDTERNLHRGHNCIALGHLLVSRAQCVGRQHGAQGRDVSRAPRLEVL